jgi:hypothetical protein
MNQYSQSGTDIPDYSTKTKYAQEKGGPLVAGISFDINESSKIKLDIKSLIGIVAGIISLAGIWFTLTAEISQLQLDVMRMQDDVALNHEFRVKWPRGEMGALPDDAKQDLKINYLQKEVDNLRKVVKDLEIKQAKTE